MSPIIVEESTPSVGDRRRLVTFSPDGTVNVVKDLEDSVAYFAVRSSFTVKPPVRKPVIASRTRRYGGGRTVFETHDNGAISWKALIAGNSADDALANVESLLGELEKPRTDLYFEWRPDGATTSVYYEIRGPATWTPTYDWAQFSGVQSMYVDIEIPVAPLAYLASTVITPSPMDLPAVVSLASAITGDAPAQAEVGLRTNGDSAAPVFALIGWTRRPASPLSGSVAPFGILEAETATGLSTWASYSNATYRGGSGIRATTSGAGTASAAWVVDPSVLDPDDFSLGEVDVEVWGRIELDGGVVSPKLTLSLEPNAGSGFGASQYSAEFGSAGRLLVRPSSGARFRFVKLGTLSMPVNPAAPLKWNIKLAGSWAAGSSGVFGVDYLNCVLARSRALSPTAKPNDATYPRFISSTADTAKTVLPDLSGQVASGAGNPGRDSGLGGTMLELPVGNVDMLLKLSSVVPDDPNSDTTSEILKHASVDIEIAVMPRVWLAKGT